MPEQEFELETVGVEYVCDTCGDGKMISGNMVLTSIPPQYPCVCNKCGATANMGRSYPTTITRRVK